VRKVFEIRTSLEIYQYTDQFFHTLASFNCLPSFLSAVRVCFLFAGVHRLQSDFVHFHRHHHRIAMKIRRWYHKCNQTAFEDRTFQIECVLCYFSLLTWSSMLSSELKQNIANPNQFVFLLCRWSIILQYHYRPMTTNHQQR
jgi:hypothetical protein